MIDDFQEESASLYVLGLLNPAEQAAFEAALVRDPELRRRVGELHRAAAALAHAAPAAEPPPALKARLLASAGESRPAARGTKSKVLTFPMLLPWAAAACFLFAAAWMAQLVQKARSENALLRNEATVADIELRSAQDNLAAERIVNQRELTEARRDLASEARSIGDLSRQVAFLDSQRKASGSLADYKVANLASLSGGSEQTVAVAVWCPSMQQGILAVSHLPRLPSGKEYQLWVIDPHYASPVSGGVFRVGAGGEARMAFTTRRPIETVQKFAVSMERIGGVESPQGPIVLLSDSPREPD